MLSTAQGHLRTHNSSFQCSKCALVCDDVHFIASIVRSEVVCSGAFWYRKLYCVMRQMCL